MRTPISGIRLAIAVALIAAANAAFIIAVRTMPTVGNVLVVAAMTIADIVILDRLGV